jgi:hypothetical protein
MRRGMCEWEPWAAHTPLAYNAADTCSSCCLNMTPIGELHWLRTESILSSTINCTYRRQQNLYRSLEIRFRTDTLYYHEKIILLRIKFLVLAYDKCSHPWRGRPQPKLAQRACYHHHHSPSWRNRLIIIIIYVMNVCAYICGCTDGVVFINIYIRISSCWHTAREEGAC